MFFSIFLLIFLTRITIATSQVDSYNLASIYVVFRHGDSELLPSDFDPNDLDTPHDIDPHAQTDLTNAGKMRSYKLGKFLRSRYDNFLGNEYRRSDVYARSTYLERTQASLQIVLAGLYPPQPKEKWHSILNWQPISIETRFSDQKKDPLMWPIDCPAYQEERDYVKRTTHFEDTMDDLVDFFTKLTYRQNLDVDSVTDDMNRISAICRYHMQNYNNRLIRLNGGMLLKKIVEDMNATINGVKMPKIHLYAGQEFNVVGFLYALNAWKAMVPTYASAVIVELWQKNSNYHIRVLYREGLKGEMEQRTISGCKEICPFEEFTKLRRDILPRCANDCYFILPNRVKCIEMFQDIEDRMECIKRQKEKYCEGSSW